MAREVFNAPDARRPPRPRARPAAGWVGYGRPEPGCGRGGAARGAYARAATDGRRVEAHPRPSRRCSHQIWVSGAGLASGRQLQLVRSTPALSLNWLRNGRNRRVTRVDQPTYACNFGDLANGRYTRPQQL